MCNNIEADGAEVIAKSLHVSVANLDLQLMLKCNIYLCINYRFKMNDMISKSWQHIVCFYISLVI